MAEFEKAQISNDESESKIDPKELNPTLKSDYKYGIALFAVQQTDYEGFCAKPSGGWF